MALQKITSAAVASSAVPVRKVQRDNGSPGKGCEHPSHHGQRRVCAPFVSQGVRNYPSSFASIVIFVLSSREIGHPVFAPSVAFCQAA